VIRVVARDEETPSRRPAAPRSGPPTPLLPATVAAAHLSACAAELAGHAGDDGPQVGDLADLAAVVRQLVDGQRDIAAALARLADHVADRHRAGALAVVEPSDVAALTEVLAAAGAATGHAADALAQGGPVLDVVLASAGPDGRI
jgi:hypothetical protein